MLPERIDDRLLAQFPLFASLDEEQRQGLGAVLLARELPPGALLYREGDPGDRMCILLTGEAEVIKALGTPDERVLGRRGAGDFLGEMSLLDPDGLRTASVRAATPLYLAELARRDFPSLLERCPGLAYEMLQELSRRLREAHDATIADLRAKNRRLEQAYQELRAAQAQIIEKERLERELQVARQIQASMLPRALPRLAHFDFGARIEAARAVGGDLFDFIPLSRERVVVVVGDVCDKGVPAALFMALTRSLLRAETYRSSSPRKVLSRVNRLLLDMNDSGMFVTMLYGVVDGRTETFTFARAGHEIPLLFDDAGRRLPLPPTRGQPLGLFDGAEFGEQTVGLPSGSTLLLYTDGAGDTTDPAGEPFGEERLISAVQAVLHGGVLAGEGPAAGEVCAGIWQALMQYQGTSAQADDVTLVAVRAQ